MSAIKRAHNKYVSNIMGDLDTEDSNSQESGIKRFWGYIKKSRKDSVGVPTLNNPNGPQTTDQSKADTLNTPFESAFTKENLDSVPDLGTPSVPAMDSIKFTVPGIQKLLEKLQRLKRQQTQMPSLPVYWRT